MTQQPTQIHDAVREYYASRLKSEESCCSSSAEDSSCCDTNDNPFHQVELLMDLPEDVANFTMGCGDAISLAKVQPGETLVDLGSGTGLECFIAGRQVGSDGHVIGIDMTPQMLEKARETAQRLDVSNVEFRQGYIEALPIDSSTVDVIISNCVINLSPDKPAVFAEMARVLKPGGRIAISDIVTKGEISAEQRKDMQLWSACASGAIPMDDWTNTLTSLGFVNIDIEPRTENDAKNREWLDQITEGEPFSALISAVKA